ncbi:MAG: hypothetical protein MI802_21335 [Desulfobacterales bacterium]|nr:hypothetical protein [Desulfobacterales bacterium]
MRTYLKFTFLVSTILAVLLLATPGFTQDEAYDRYEASFRNFIKCELTRTDAMDHFKGKAFKITMVNLHGIRNESGIKILTGAVQCFAGDTYHTLYTAVGVTQVAGKEIVSYYTIRKKRFSILATELIRYPYMERCPWSRYWVDLD